MFIYTLDEFHLTQSLKTESYTTCLYTIHSYQKETELIVLDERRHTFVLYFTTLDKLVCCIIDYTKNLWNEAKIKSLYKINEFHYTIKWETPPPLPLLFVKL